MTDATIDRVAAPVPDGVLLDVRDLTVHFRVGGGLLRRPSIVHAVDGISFALRSGETLGLVGESGCGKTTTGRAVLRLTPVTGGSVLYEGTDLLALSAEQVRRMRRRLQIVFQDPFASLNPRLSVGEIIGEPLRVHGLAHGAGLRTRVGELLTLVGLGPAAAGRYPHQFSGGQRQRIGIARALAVEPRFVVLDEPVSALDVSIQSQILNLLLDLQTRLNLTYLFIAHDLAVVGQMSDRVAVMYLGVIVEEGATADLYRDPRHPYTQALFSAIPIPDPELELTRRRITLAGEVPNPINPPSGCRFHTRCPIATDRCRAEVPALRTLAPGHRVACHYAEESPRLMAVAVDRRAAPGATTPRSRSHGREETPA
jgi:oligopeptide transport system ATP-binding protein